MPGVSEQEVFGALLTAQGESGWLTVGSVPVRVSLEAMDNHFRDSPDAILWLSVELTVFDQSLKVRVPILVEAEKAGLFAAIEDLEKFVERKRFPLELPMLVVADKGYGSHDARVEFPVRVKIQQLPVGRLSPASDPP